MALSNEDLLTRYAAEHYERHSISTPRRGESDAILRKLAARLDGRTLLELTPSDLMTWQGAELKRVKPNTVRKNQNMVRAFIHWAQTAQLMSFELSAQLKSVGDVRGGCANLPPRPYKRTEIQAFREALAATYTLAPPHGKGSLMIRRYLQGASPFGGVIRRHARRLQLEAQVSVALEEGLRKIELCEITLAEIHSDNAAVVVRTAKGAPGQQRIREVPWTNHSRLCVQEWLEFRALLSPGHDGPWLALRGAEPLARLSMTSLTGVFRPLAGHWNWHRFRHTYGTERLRAGMPLEQLQYMMGHARLEQTLAYTEIVSADVRVEADRTEEAFERALGLAA